MCISISPVQRGLAFVVIISGMGPFVRFSIAEFEDMTMETGVSKMVEALRIKVVFLAYLAGIPSFYFVLCFMDYFIWGQPSNTYRMYMFYPVFCFFFSFERSFMIFKPLYCSKQKDSLFYLTVCIGDLVN